MAVREGLTNAVVHREYASTGPILMSIFADRLEILNQGGLLPNFTIDEVLRGVSEQRNEKLAAVFYRLGLLEGYGSGYSRMLSSYAGTGKKPEISVTRFSFMLTLPNVNGGLGGVSGRAVIREQPQQVVPAVSLEDLSERARERMQKVLQRCRQQPQITRAEAQDCWAFRRVRRHCCLTPWCSAGCWCLLVQDQRRPIARLAWLKYMRQSVGGG